MKQQVLIDGWWIRQATEAEKTADHASFSQVPCADKDGWVFTKNAEQIQKVLLENSLLDERVAVGETERCAWIEQEDWIYRCDFHCDNDSLEQGKRNYLNFKGVDLFADFYLNGEWIGSHDNMLIPKRIEVTGKLQKENHLMVYFYSTRKRMDALFAAMPEEFQRNSKPHCMLRKGQIEFGDAGKVSMINVGLYADVLLEVIDLAEITWPDIETTLDFWHRFADIHYTLHGSGTLGTAYFTTALYSPSGILLHEEQIPLLSETPEWQASSSIRVPSPELWWPIHYGKQPLYRLVFSLYADGRLLDTAERQIGIREVKKTGDMRFRINGKEIKQWGALLEPFNGLTHRWDSRKCREMLDLTEHANINTLRIWGGSMQFEDELYNECDRRGILLWHEFCLSWHPTPDTEEYSRQYRREAEYEVRRVKHHPCVLLYSGGNESLVGLIEGLPDHPAFGWKAFMKDFKEVCQKLDPNRFYLDSSPCGGDYPSDPAGRRLPSALLHLPPCGDAIPSLCL